MTTLIATLVTLITMWTIATSYGSVKEFVKAIKKDFGFGLMVFVSTIMFFILFYMVFSL